MFVNHRSGGQSLGVVFKKGASGRGAVIKGLDAGSQAEKYPELKVGLLITCVVDIVNNMRAAPSHMHCM